MTDNVRPLSAPAKAHLLEVVGDALSQPPSATFVHDFSGEPDPAPAAPTFARSDSGYPETARALLAEIRQYDARFSGESDGIAAALITQALYAANIDGINECRSAVSLAFDRAGVPSPGAA